MLSGQVNGYPFIRFSDLGHLELPLSRRSPSEILTTGLTSLTKGSHIGSPAMPIRSALYLFPRLPSSQVSSRGTPVGLRHEGRSHFFRWYQLVPLMRSVFGSPTPVKTTLPYT